MPRGPAKQTRIVDGVKETKYRLTLWLTYEQVVRLVQDQLEAGTGETYVGQELLERAIENVIWQLTTVAKAK